MPDELLELPYNASDSRQSLHNGGGGATHSETISNGAIPIQMGSSNGEHYYQPDIDDTGQSAMIKIDVPAEVSRDEPKFPKEKLKTFYCEWSWNDPSISVTLIPALSFQHLWY